MEDAGQGSYGTVYKASVRNTDQLVAVKILPLGQQNEQATIQKEIDMLKECEHPNIVRYMVSIHQNTELSVTSTLNPPAPLREQPPTHVRACLLQASLEGVRACATCEIPGHRSQV